MSESSPKKAKVDAPEPFVLGCTMPNFEADSTFGRIKYHEYVGDHWSILFSHPADFTPVCTTELNTVQWYLPEFEKRGVKVCALSCDSVESHNAWVKDVCAFDAKADPTGSGKLAYPIVADPKRELAFRLGMLDAVAKDSEGMPLPCRAVFVCGPDKKLKLSILYPASTGRNFDEIIRVIDSLQLTAVRKLATPANWVAGGDCVVVPSVPTAEARTLFKDVRVVDLPSKKEYLRMTKDPR
jgi:1-Cys peroxiredoxin 6